MHTFILPNAKNYEKLRHIRQPPYNSDGPLFNCFIYRYFTMKTQDNKPEAKLIGSDGNTLSLLSVCTRALKRAGQHDKADELTIKVFKASSYEEALIVMGEYCDIV